MARPASRYFVPIMRKISEMKKAENIRIDEQFKADLRGQLILRAGLGEAGERKISREQAPRELSEDGSGNRLLDFFNKWKLQMALVPVAFMLVLVAVQSLKMPVSVESETIIPMAKETQTADMVKSSEVDSNEADLNDLTEQTAAGSQETAQSHEVNADGGDAVSVGGVSLTESGEVQYINAGTVGTAATGGGGGAPEGSTETVEPTGVSRTVQPMQQIVQPTTQVVQPTEQIVQPVPYVQQPVSNVSNVVPVNTGGGSESGSNKKPGVAAGDVPPELMNNITETDLSSDVLEQSVKNVQNVDLGTGTTAVPRVNQAPVVNMAPVVNTVPASRFAGEVYYDFSFSGDKTSLEQDVLKTLMGGGAYDYAAVYQADDGVVTVELSSSDGPVTTKTYKRNTRTRAWDEIIYVQKYYFEDRLQYDRLNITAPSYAPSFDRFGNPDYYRYGY